MIPSITLPEIEINPDNLTKQTYNPQDMLLDAYASLLTQNENGNLSNEGKKVLAAFQTGSISNSGFGMYLKGLTSSLSDEALGFFESVRSENPELIAEFLTEFDPTQSQQKITPYQVARDIERVGQKQYAEENPGKALAYETAGGITQAVLPGGQVKGIVSGIKQGTGYAAASAFGESEGLASKQAFDTAGGGVVGGVLGGTFTGGGRVAKKIYDVAFETPTKVLQKQTDKIVKEALQQDFGTLEELLAEVSRRQGKPIILADLGTNTRAMLEAANMIPTPNKAAATKFLEDRSRGMPVRLTSDIQQAFGKNASFYDEFNAMRSAKTARAKKLYRPAFKVTIPVTNDLKQLLNRPSVISGYERAMNIVKEGGLDDPGFRLVNGKLFKLTPKGNVSRKEIDSIPTDFLHTIKMGLDENLGDATKASFMGQGAATGANASSLNAMRDTKNLFLDFIDSNNKQYKLARDYYAGDMSVMTAMDQGRKIFTKDIIENPQKFIAEVVDKMSMSEKEALRTGIMNEVLSKIGGATTTDVMIANRNLARSFLTNPKQLRILEKTFRNKQSFNTFIKNFKDEADMFETMGILKGSQTAPRQAALETLFENIKDTSGDVNVSKLLIKMFGEDLKELNIQHKKLIAGRVVSLLAESNPKEIKAIVNRLNEKGAGDYIKKAFGYSFETLTSPRVLMQQPGQMVPNMNLFGGTGYKDYPTR